MPYATAADLLQQANLRDVMESIAGQDDLMVIDVKLLRDTVNNTIDGADSWTEMETETANAMVARISTALERAEEKVNAYLGNRYQLPLSSVPELLKGVTCDLALSRLYVSNVPEQVEERRKEAIRLLEQINTGKVSLGLDATDQEVAGDSLEAVGVAPGRTFSHDTLAQF